MRQKGCGTALIIPSSSLCSIVTPFARLTASLKCVEAAFIIETAATAAAATATATESHDVPLVRFLRVQSVPRALSSLHFVVVFFLSSLDPSRVESSRVDSTDSLSRRPYLRPLARPSRRLHTAFSLVVSAFL